MNHQYSILLKIWKMGYVLLGALGLKIVAILPFKRQIKKWPNTLKQFVAKLSTNCLTVLGHFVGLALKGFRQNFKAFKKIYLLVKINYGPTLYDQHVHSNICFDFFFSSFNHNLYSLIVTKHFKYTEYSWCFNLFSFQFSYIFFMTRISL